MSTILSFNKQIKYLHDLQASLDAQFAGILSIDYDETTFAGTIYLDTTLFTASTNALQTAVTNYVDSSAARVDLATVNILSATFLQSNTGIIGLKSHLDATNTWTLRNLATPVANGDAVPKLYVDNTLLSAGTGISINARAISVLSSQPTITSLGTLTSLSVSGNTSLGTVTASQSTVQSISVTNTATLATVNVTGSTTLAAVTANALSASPLISRSTLAVAGATTLSSTLDAGATSVTSLLCTGTVTIQDAATFSTSVSAGSLNVSNVTTLNNTQTISSVPLTINAATLFSKSTTLGSTLLSGSSIPSTGAVLTAAPTTYNDTSSAGTVNSAWSLAYFARPTLSATNNVTTTYASTLTIADAPLASGSQTITTPVALRIVQGMTWMGGELQGSGKWTNLNVLDATSVSSGAITTAGGVGIAKSLFVGGAAQIALTLSVTGGTTVSGNVIVNATTTSSAIGTGSIVAAGGLSCAKDLFLGGRLVFSTGSNTVSLASSATANYTIALPPIPPTAPNVTLVVTNATTGQLAWTDPFTLIQYYNGATLQTKTVQYTGSVNSNASGQAIFYATTTGTSTGAPLFSAYYTIQSNAVLNTNTARSVALTGISSISNDLRTVTINVVTGTTVGLGGGNTIIFAPSGTLVTIFILGAAA